jgi:hypothetical protein
MSRRLSGLDRSFPHSPFSLNLILQLCVQISICPNVKITTIGLITNSVIKYWNYRRACVLMKKALICVETRVIMERHPRLGWPDVFNCDLLCSWCLNLMHDTLVQNSRTVGPGFVLYSEPNVFTHFTAINAGLINTKIEQGRGLTSHGIIFPC